jgi:hypothetical protein
VLEALGEAAHGARQLGVDRVLGALRRRRVVGLVEDEERSRTLVLQPVAQRGGVRLVAQERVREDEEIVRRERVDGVPALPPAVGDEGPIEHREGEAKAGVELVAPLEDHGGRARHHDLADLLAHQELAQDEARLDRLADADLVGDEQVHPGEEERLPEGLELVGLRLDAGAIGRLEEPGIGRRDAVPPLDVQVRREPPRVVEALRHDAAPGRGAEDAGVDLALPEDRERSALRVVVEARKLDEGLLVAGRRGCHRLDEVLAQTDADDLPGLRGDGGLRHGLQPYQRPPGQGIGTATAARPALRAPWPAPAGRSRTPRWGSPPC